MNESQPEHLAAPSPIKAANGRLRFSLAALMVVVTALAVILGVARLMGPRLVAEILFVLVGWAVILAPLLVFGALRLLRRGPVWRTGTACLAALGGIALVGTIVVLAADGWNDAFSVLLGLGCLTSIWLLQCAMIWCLHGCLRPNPSALQRRRALPRRFPPFSSDVLPRTFAHRSSDEVTP